ncbi:MAG: valine--tRNA ligase [Legionellales bacterium]|nr:valine--tRNA ligase [Legionellales bacterium]
MLEKSYQPKSIEAAVQEIWDTMAQSNATPEQGAEPFCICIPPPNVTGDLHMGHAFQLSIIDILVRFNRMNGRDTHWQVGTDHAGISTQMVVERQLEQAGIDTKAIGREAFIQHIWEWISHRNIKHQIKRMGASVDWTKERFTLDEPMSHAVQTAFIQLHQQGLIYRGKKLVHWEVNQQTAVSDLEVENQEHDGHLYHFRYPLKEASSDCHSITIATTRPETLLGDTAVAVHPTDERYRHLIGKTVILPIVGREIPIIADDYVDPAFGSGCVKITPAHDFNDYEVGMRHDLPIINLLNPDGTFNSNAPKSYQHLDIKAARDKVVADMQALALVDAIEPHKHVVPVCDRTQTVLEPYLTQQWFMNMKELAKRAIQVVENGDIEFHPKHEEKVYFHWLNHIQDWCISRQLWWGHRIPAWYDASGKYYVGTDEATVRRMYHVDESIELFQDNDVLDTWFSSALWPFATLGWPNKTVDLDKFFPNSLMVTGFDILFFWVARMIMMSLALTNQVPFKRVYMHGLVRDESGEKMSKSKGNVLDPLDLIDGVDLETLIQKRTQHLMQPHKKKSIEKATRKHFKGGIEAHGTDALRMTFCALATTGRDIPFNLQRLNGYRNFCNKIWNATRFSLNYLTDESTPIDETALADLDPVHHWLLTKLNQCIDDYHRCINDYRFDQLAQTCFNFCWNIFCDWYIEFSKLNFLLDPSSLAYQQNQQVLHYALKQMLLLLHPVIPYITESLWQSVSPNSKPCAISDFPRQLILPESSQSHYESIEWLRSTVTSIRTIRSEMNIAPKRGIQLQVELANTALTNQLDIYQNWIKSLCKIDRIVLLGEQERPDPSASFWQENTGFHIPLAGLIDTDKELNRLDKVLANLKADIEKSQGLLSNEQYVQQAPVTIVNKQRDALQVQVDLERKLRSQRMIIQDVSDREA